MTRRLSCLAVLVLVSGGCEALWPKCASDDDCPSTHACRDGRCTQTVQGPAAPDGGGVGSSSAGESSSSPLGSSSAAGESSSSSLGSSSAAGESSSSSLGSSSAAAESSSSSLGSSSLTGESSSSSSGSSSLTGESSSSAAGESSSSLETTSSSAGPPSTSSSASASSGPYCGPYTNNASNRALPFSVGQSFQTAFCRDGDSPEYFWVARDVEARAGTKLVLNVQQRSVTDAGEPLHRVNHIARADGQSGLAMTALCNNHGSPAQTCEGLTDRWSRDLQVSVALPAVQQDGSFTHLSEVRLDALPTCPADPEVPTPAAAAWILLGVRKPLCRSGVPYHFKYVCPVAHMYCLLNVQPLDGTHAVTPLDVEVTAPADLLRPCPMGDAGVHTCRVLGLGDGGWQYVRVSANAPGLDAGEPLPASEFVHVSAWGAGDAGP